MKRYELAIIACTATKNPLGRTAVTLYRGGPFSLTLRHAQAQSDEVLIMSAKYGLLGLHDPVEHYDTYLPDLDPLEREDLVERVAIQAINRKLARLSRAASYLPLAYFAVLEEAAPNFAACMDRPFKGIGMLKAWGIMSRELKTADTHDIRRAGLLE